MTGEELNKILENHLHWLCEDVEGWEDMRANLRNADLRHADLCGAKLSNADLSGADLNGANLSNADLRYADLNGAKLTRAKGDLIEYRTGKVLTDDIIGFKKCKNNVIVKLLIPRGAIVFSINGNKCRTNKAKVLEIEGADRAISNYKHMSYYVGDEFTVYNFDCIYNKECGAGIHFFMTKEEAVRY